MKHIINYVSEKLNIPEEEIEGKSRKKEIVEARHIAVALVVGKFNSGPVETMKAFNRDHSVFYHSLGAVKDRYDTESAYRKMFREMCIEMGVDPEFLEDKIFYRKMG